MPSSTETLPVELWQMITCIAEPEDLRQLRCVNSTLKILATPAVFENIVVRNSLGSANKLWELLRTPHLVRHIRSITFLENHDHMHQDCLEDFRVATAWDPCWGRIIAAFDILHQAPALNTLTLRFTPFPCDYVDANHEVAVNYSYYQWDIIKTLGGNRNPLPKLESLTIRHWISAWEPEFESPYQAPSISSLYQSPSISPLATSLLHLEFSIPPSDLRRSLEQRILFWKEVVVEAMLKPVVKLESLRIIGFENFCVHGCLEEQCFDLSQVPTYPRLDELSLEHVVFEDLTTDEKGIVIPSMVENFIVRHARTLTKLKLHRCAIKVVKGRTRPFRYWADIFDRLTKALTKLAELEVVFGTRDGEMPRYVHVSGGDEEYGGYYRRSEGLEGTEQDELALEEFKANIT